MINFFRAELNQFSSEDWISSCCNLQYQIWDFFSRNFQLIFFVLRRRRDLLVVRDREAVFGLVEHGQNFLRKLRSVHLLKNWKSLQLIKRCLSYKLNKEFNRIDNSVKEYWKLLFYLAENFNVPQFSKVEVSLLFEALDGQLGLDQLSVELVHLLVVCHCGRPGTWNSGLSV